MSPNALATFKGMVLSLSSGGHLTEKQLNYILNWVEKNIQKVHWGKLADIAWQYDVSELHSQLANEYKKFKDGIDP